MPSSGLVPIHSDAHVYSCFLQKGHNVEHSLKDGRGAYIYVLEGDSITVNGNTIPVLGAGEIVGGMDIHISADGYTELLLVDVLY